MTAKQFKQKLSSLKKRPELSHPQLIIFILAFGLIGYFLYRSFAAAPLVATLEAEQMSLPAGGSVITDTSASGGKAVQLLNNGTAGGSVSFASSVTSLSVIAKATQCAGSPTMTVAIDGNNVISPTAVAATSWTSYTASASLTGGTHNLTINFSGDYAKVRGSAKNRCDRNLSVDVSNFFGPTPTPTPAPTVALSASPTSVTAGSASTLTWNSTNATACTASGAWSGSQPTSGSVSTGAINQNSTYTLTCSGAGGSASASAVIAVSVPPPTATGVTWGMAGGYTASQITDLAARGIKLGLVEMTWASAEPGNGTYDENYFTSIKNQIAQLRAAGFQVILNYGVHHAPGWVLSMPDARYVNEYGQTYTASDEPNLIFTKGLRSYAESYTAKVFSELGTNFFAVRVGGGHFGEMQYPGQKGTDGKWQWWAFDNSALAASPVPSYKPCSGSATQAGTFLNWYQDSITDFQNWQVSTVRKSYPGKIAVLYASWGMRAGDFDKAVTGNLCGTSSAEINGEVQRGYDHSRHINALTDPNAAVWATWVDNSGTVSYLSSLAAAKGLVMMGENSGEDSYTLMQSTVATAKQYNLQGFIWIRASEAYCNCSGYATIDNYDSLIP